MSVWTFNVSDSKKNLMESVEKKYKEYEGQNFMNHEVDIVKPIVQLILDKFPDVHEEKLVEVQVSKGEMEGKVSININVVLS
jgi:hypothetical protein